MLSDAISLIARVLKVLTFAQGRDAVLVFRWIPVRHHLDAVLQRVLVEPIESFQIQVIRAQTRHIGRRQRDALRQFLDLIVRSHRLRLLLIGQRSLSSSHFF